MDSTKDILLLQKIIAVMLCEQVAGTPPNRREIDPEFVKEVLTSGNFWASVGPIMDWSKTRQLKSPMRWEIFLPCGGRLSMDIQNFLRRIKRTSAMPYIHQM